jgi:hypothetical protein
MSGVIDARIVIAGLARDSAEHLKAIFANIDNLASCFRDKAYIFLENDSTDHTRACLEAFRDVRPNTRLEHFDGLGESIPQRTVRLAWLRNHYLSLITQEYADYDYLLVIDCDDASAYRMDYLAFHRAIEFLDHEPGCAGVFPNQDGFYYDLWALRHPTWCPGDIWEESLDHYVIHGGSDDEVFRTVVGPRLRTLGRFDAPIQVHSAFGGMGLYKISSVVKNARRSKGYKIKNVLTPEGDRDVGWQVCEHVDFHRGFGDHGEKLFILPFLINRPTVSYFEALNGWLVSSVWRRYLFELDQLAAPS